ncbi:hypothetical protein C7418_0284 [Cupriavidus plantarum]|nr:hypothetical protein C7418_0284 [Cupriavidus plantarum]
MPAMSSNNYDVRATGPHVLLHECCNIAHAPDFVDQRFRMPKPRLGRRRAGVAQEVPASFEKDGADVSAHAWARLTEKILIIDDMENLEMRVVAERNANGFGKSTPGTTTAVDCDEDVLVHW